MRVRSRLAVLVSVIAVGACMVSGCGSSVVRPTVLTLANNLPEDNCTTTAIQWFADKVEERTDGRIVIEIYNDGKLGDSLSCIEQLQYGGVDIVKTDVSVLTNFVKDFNALAMPYIYNDEEHFQRVHRGRIGMDLLRGEEMRKENFYGLTYYDGGIRCFYSNRGEIHSPEDLKGMMVRIQSSNLMMKMMETMGAEPVTTEFSEVYSALQPGMADAAENSIVNYINESHYQVAPYFVEDEHTRSADVLMMSETTREKLSPEDQQILERTALDSWDYQEKLWAREEERSRRALAGKQVTVTRLTEEEHEKFRQLCEPIWYAYDNGAYNDLIDRIVASGK